MGLYKFVQEFCNKYGFTDYEGKKLVVDDIPGERSKSAVKKFQNKAKQLGIHKYNVDGEAGPYTKEAMKIYDMAKGNISSPTPTKSAFHRTVEEHVGFTYNSIDEFFNKMANKGYQYYNNNVYPQGEALDRIKNNRPLNCSDYSQILYAVGKDLKLEMHYGHLKCKEGGHIVVIKGSIKSGIVYDLAKKASVNSSFTAPGDYWCKGTGYFVSYDDPWLISDDGKT